MMHTTSNAETLQLPLYERIATELSLKPEQVQRTVALLLDDATVPFIARYRKEATGTWMRNRFVMWRSAINIIKS